MQVRSISPTGLPDCTYLLALRYSIAELDLDFLHVDVDGDDALSVIYCDCIAMQFKYARFGEYYLARCTCSNRTAGKTCVVYTRMKIIIQQFAVYYPPDTKS